ncbi:MAG: DUF3795 domain-containing protein [Ruminococcus sp.]|nr:DUF3795 domain-containing protein [Ruminococcus sp.]
MEYEEYMMISDKTEKVEKSIAPCGLICELCSERSHCKGCNFSKKDELGCCCYQRMCCDNKKISGCWECQDFPCEKDMHDVSQHGVRLVAFVRYAKIIGLHSLAECIVKNEEKGILYQSDPVNYTGDYDGFNTEDEVIELLMKGNLKEDAKQ